MKRAEISQEKKGKKGNSQSTINEWMNEQTNKQTIMNEQTNEWKSEEVNECKEWVNESTNYIYLLSIHFL